MNLESLKQNTAGASANPNLNTQGGGDVPPSTEEVKFQHYTSARQSVKLLTSSGRSIEFVNFQFITADEELIDYLNNEIRLGLTTITKGELMTAEEADPMVALKRKWQEEYDAELAEKAKKAALGQLPDMGNTKPKEQRADNVLGSNKINTLAASSDSSVK